MIQACIVLTQCQHVRDGWTDRQLQGYYRALHRSSADVLKQSTRLLRVLHTLQCLLWVALPSSDNDSVMVSQKSLLL